MDSFKFYVLTDTHYFASVLGCKGKEYDEFMQFEQKCFAETEAINKATFKWLEQTKDADTVLIAGDLSFNGEKQSHLEFTKLLKSLKKSGKKIYVITAGHDYNEHPFAFDETGRIEPEGTKREELFDLYYEFGFKDAISVHKESLSYVAQVAPNIRLLALNCDGDKINRKTYTPQQIEWILQQTKKAREDGQMMFAMNHYPLIPACPVLGLINDAVMPNADNIIDMLADEGVHLCFTGHMHNQSIKLKLNKNGNRFWDVCTGSIIGCPAAIRFVEIKDKSNVSIKTLPIPDFEWDFDSLTQDEYLQRQFDMMINTYLDCLTENPEKLLRKINAPNNEALIKILNFIGQLLNTVTIKDLCKNLLIKCPSDIADMHVREYLTNIIRNVFVGNAPYVAGTSEYHVFMGVLDRMPPVIHLLNNIIKVNGKKINIKDMFKNSIGHYGVDEYNTALILE